jgi:FAD:protein FMN transferase
MMPIVEVGKSFFAMNTTVNAVVCVPERHVVDACAALNEVESFFARAEGVLSRFNPESELSRLNSATGKPFVASSILFDVVAAALESARSTNGLIDPAVLSQLYAAGYDRSFHSLKRAGSGKRSECKAVFNWEDIQLDFPSRSIMLPEGGGLDLGGVGKGWTADAVRGILHDFSGYVIDAGGDVVVEGTQGNGRPWTIGIADPFDDERDLLEIEMTGGAVCTSSVLRRQWRQGDGIAHHIIDLRTGEPACSGIVSATVSAATAVLAETITKTAIILGAEKGMEFIRRHPGVEGLLVGEDHEILYSPGLKEMAYVA